MRPLFAELIAVALAAAIAGCQDSVTAAGPRGLSEDSPSFSAATSTTRFHFVSNGLAGDVGWCDFDGVVSVCGYLYLTSARTNETYLYYGVYRCGPDYCNAVAEGSGLIPSRDLSGAPKGLHLSTNTSSNPDFVVFAGTGGLVSVDWLPNGIWQSRASGTSFTESTPSPSCDTSCQVPFTQHIQGVVTGASATVIGTVAGIVIPSASGWINTNHQVLIEVYR